MPRSDLDAIRKRRALVCASTGPHCYVAMPDISIEFYQYASMDISDLLRYVEELEPLYEAVTAFMEAGSKLKRPYIPAELADEWCVVIGTVVGLTEEEEYHGR